jgi:hypothetical protein
MSGPVRSQVVELAARGPLPHELDIADDDLAERSALLASIDPPLSEAESAALLRVLGSDDCFGLAWTVVSLLESTPGWPAESLTWDVDNPWHQRLLRRAMSRKDGE